MPHTCKVEGCSNPPFNEFCKYHQFMLYKRGGRLYKPKKPKQAKLPLESKTRKKEHLYYSQGCKQLEAELREQNNGVIYDFFTGLEIKGKITFHHIAGRSGDFYLDKEFLVPAENDENDGHLFWHHATIEQLKEKPWYEGFLARLKSKSIDAYNKEIRRQDKAQPLNPKLFEESEDLFA
jgi:hypothetical protein